MCNRISQRAAAYLWRLLFALYFCLQREEKPLVAEDGFDSSTSGLWAQRASATLLSFMDATILVFLSYEHYLGSHISLYSKLQFIR